MVELTNEEFFLLRKTKLYEVENIMKSIRSSIVPTERLLDGSTPIARALDKNREDYYSSSNEFIRDTIRCYAYAFGIMFAEKFKSESDTDSIFYYPGFTMENTFDYSTDSCYTWTNNLMETVKQDLENLKIDYREIPLNGDISLRKEEYLVKAFFKPKGFVGIPDFHFVRFSPKTNIWFHRMGRYGNLDIIEKSTYYKPLYKLEFEEKSIYEMEPKIIYANRGWYDSVGYFAIKEPSWNK